MFLFLYTLLSTLTTFYRLSTTIKPDPEGPAGAAAGEKGSRFHVFDTPWPVYAPQSRVSIHQHPPAPPQKPIHPFRARPALSGTHTPENACTSNCMRVPFLFYFILFCSQNACTRYTCFLHLFIYSFIATKCVYEQSYMYTRFLHFLFLNSLFIRSIKHICFISCTNFRLTC